MSSIGRISVFGQIQDLAKAAGSRTLDPKAKFMKGNRLVKFLYDFLWFLGAKELKLLNSSALFGGALSKAKSSQLPQVSGRVSRRIFVAG